MRFTKTGRLLKATARGTGDKGLPGGVPHSAIHTAKPLHLRDTRMVVRLARILPRI